MVAISRSSDTESLLQLPHLHTAPSYPFTPATVLVRNFLTFLHLFSWRAAVALQVQPPRIVPDACGHQR